MRYDYKVTDITEDDNNDKVETMSAMSLKKLRRKLDPKKKYHIEYKNKKNNFVSATISGIEPK